MPQSRWDPGRKVNARAYCSAFWSSLASPLDWRTNTKSGFPSGATPTNSDVGSAVDSVPGKLGVDRGPRDCRPDPISNCVSNIIGGPGFGCCRIGSNSSVENTDN